MHSEDTFHAVVICLIIASFEITLEIAFLGTELQSKPGLDFCLVGMYPCLGVHKRYHGHLLSTTLVLNENRCQF